MIKKYLISQSLLLLISLSALIGGVVIASALTQDHNLGSAHHPLAIIATYLMIFLENLAAVAAVVGGICVSLFFFIIWKKRQKVILDQAKAEDENNSDSVASGFFQHSGIVLGITVGLLLLIQVGSIGLETLESVFEQRQSDQQFLNDHPEGSFVLYHANGNKELEGFYDENGLMQGELIGWWPNGKKQFFTTITDGTEKPYKEENLDLKRLEVLINFNGTFNSPTSIWYDNGQIKYKGYYTNEHPRLYPSGKYQYWWPDRTLKYERQYNPNGSAHWQYWYENGQLEFDIQFSNTDDINATTEMNILGTRENGLGSWSEGVYNDEGRRTALINKSPTTVIGHRHGTWTRWYPDGQMRSQTIWRHGAPDGVHTNWYSDGKISVQTSYANGQLDGLMTHWYANGQKRYEILYRNGTKEGQPSLWNEDCQKREVN